MMDLDSSLIEEARDWTPGSEEGRVGYGSLESEKGGLGLREEVGVCAVCHHVQCVSISLLLPLLPPPFLLCE